jgi:hypothetical protein
VLAGERHHDYLGPGLDDTHATLGYVFAINGLGASPGATLKAYVPGMRHKV